ncbi:MAG: hypothetical protein KJO98_07620 [Rhodothermia bacterium]|nr:hypothetical protein [Rhodothermia bacterium]
MVSVLGADSFEKRSDKYCRQATWLQVLNSLQAREYGWGDGAAFVISRHRLVVLLRMRIDVVVALSIIDGQRLRVVATRKPVRIRIPRDAKPVQGGTGAYE